MRKIRIAAGLIASALFLTPVSAFAEKVDAPHLKLSVGDKPYTFVYGQPIIEDGNSLFPLRDLLVTLGISNDDQHIHWDEITQTITIKSKEDVITLTIGQKEIFRNGKLFKSLEVAAQIINGYTYIPARAVAESLSFKVGYEASSTTVTFSEGPVSETEKQPEKRGTISYGYMEIWTMMDNEPKKVEELISPELTAETLNYIFDFGLRYREEAIISKLLAQKLIDPNHVFTEQATPLVPGPTPLWLSLAKTYKNGAPQEPNTAIIEMLLQAGAKPDNAALAQAVQRGYTEYVKLLLSNGANPNGRVISTIGGRTDASIMFTAIQWFTDRPVQTGDIIKLLLDAGAVPSAEEASFVMHFGSLELFEQMLIKGLDANISFNGRPLVQDAFDSKLEAQVDLLVKYGAKRPVLPGKPAAQGSAG